MGMIIVSVLCCAGWLADDDDDGHSMSLCCPHRIYISVFSIVDIFKV